jgi:hypothetical protein
VRWAPGALDDYPPGTRIIVRRQRTQPGAQLDLIETRDGWRYTCFATDTRIGQHAWLDARHRYRARVEGRIRCGKDTGLGRFPSRQFAINQAWLACALTAIDLLAWAQTILLPTTPHSPKRNRRSCATGGCTSPPGSCAARQTPAQDRPHWRWAHRWPPPSTGYAPCPRPQPEPAARDPATPTDNPQQSPGGHPAPYITRQPTRSPAATEDHPPSAPE